MTFNIIPVRPNDDIALCPGVQWSLSISDHCLIMTPDVLRAHLIIKGKDEPVIGYCSINIISEVSEDRIEDIPVTITNKYNYHQALISSIIIYDSSDTPLLTISGDCDILEFYPQDPTQPSYSLIHVPIPVRFEKISE